jgi:hypothetical protein
LLLIDFLEAWLFKEAGVDAIKFLPGSTFADRLLDMPLSPAATLPPVFGGLALKNETSLLLPAEKQERDIADFGGGFAR